MPLWVLIDDIPRIFYVATKDIKGTDNLQESELIANYGHEYINYLNNLPLEPDRESWNGVSGTLYKLLLQMTCNTNHVSLDIQC